MFSSVEGTPSSTSLYDSGEFVVFPPSTVHLAHQLLHFHATGHAYSHDYHQITSTLIGYVVESDTTTRQGVNFNTYWPVDRSALSNAIKNFHSLVFPLVACSTHFRKWEENFLAQQETSNFPNRPLGFSRGQAPKDPWVPKELKVIQNSTRDLQKTVGLQKLLCLHRDKFLPPPKHHLHPQLPDHLPGILRYR